MLSDKSKKIINIVVWVAVGIAIIMMIISAIIEVSENHRIAKEEFEQRKILENALENLDSVKCRVYADPLKCAAMISRRTNLKACENLVENPLNQSYFVLACKATASENLSFCNTLNKNEKWVCEELAESAIRRLNNEN